MSGSQLVLSIFPGIDVLGLGFEREGFTVVRGPDVIWGGDIREFHPPVGVFDSVIGGDPCQSHSTLANLVRAKGLTPRFPDMTPEFQRVVEEARPAWFLRENVPGAPDIKPAGFAVRSFLLDNWASLGEEASRRRRFWFGVRDPEPCPELRRWIEFALFLPEDPADTLVHDEVRAEPRKLKRTATSCDGRHGHRTRRDAVTTRTGKPPGPGGTRQSVVTGRHDDAIGATGGHFGNPARYTIAEMLQLQGLPEDFLDHCPFTAEGKRRAIGNAVSLPMARALAGAIRAWLSDERTAA